MQNISLLCFIYEFYGDSRPVFDTPMEGLEIRQTREIVDRKCMSTDGTNAFYGAKFDREIYMIGKHSTECFYPDIFACGICADTECLYIGDKTEIEIYNIATQELKAKIHAPIPAMNLRVGGGYLIVFNYDEDAIADSRTIVVLDIETLSCKMSLELQEEFVDIEVSDKYLFVVQKAHIVIYDLQYGIILRKINRIRASLRIAKDFIFEIMENTVHMTTHEGIYAGGFKYGRGGLDCIGVESSGNNLFIIDAGRDVARITHIDIKNRNVVACASSNRGFIPEAYFAFA